MEEDFCLVRFRSCRKAAVLIRPKVPRATLTRSNFGIRMHFASQGDRPETYIHCKFDHFLEGGVPELLKIRQLQSAGWNEYRLIQGSLGDSIGLHQMLLERRPETRQPGSHTISGHIKRGVRVAAAGLTY
jgi:hypothetical protein